MVIAGFSLESPAELLLVHFIEDTTAVFHRQGMNPTQYPLEMEEVKRQLSYIR